MSFSVLNQNSWLERTEISEVPAHEEKVFRLMSHSKISVSCIEKPKVGLEFFSSFAPREFEISLFGTGGTCCSSKTWIGNVMLLLFPILGKFSYWDLSLPQGTWKMKVEGS